MIYFADTILWSGGSWSFVILIIVRLFTFQSKATPTLGLSGKLVGTHIDFSILSWILSFWWFDEYFTQNNGFGRRFLVARHDKKLRQDCGRGEGNVVHSVVSNVADMLLEKVKFGEQSCYLDQIN